MSVNDQGAQPELDVVIVGAGFGGLYALHHLRGLGLRCRLYEAGGGVGGTWYWNRYPGARCDVESVEYSYGFDDELQQEWRWSERYAGQAEIRRYLDHVADRFDLRRDIRFDAPIKAAVFDEESAHWVLTTAEGERVRARYCVMGIGFLSARYLPDIPGLRDFEGELHHTGAWPHTEVDFTGKRVGIIGAGASGIQAIPIIADQAEHLFVFQRSPHWAVPLRNTPMPPEYERWVKQNYAEIRRREREMDLGGFMLCDLTFGEQNTRSALEVTDEERREEYEFRWRVGGLHYYFSFADLAVDEAANRTLCEFVEDKIRSIVKDPETADALVPRHAIMTKRLCGENGYYEAFNRENVTLVNARRSPISESGPTGLRLADGQEYPLDMIVCATGWDSATGPFVRMDIRGREGRSLADHWSQGCRTHLGMMSHGFPNMFILDGPQTPSAFYSPPLLIEQQVPWMGQVIGHLATNGDTSIEPAADAEEAWVAQVQEIAKQLLIVQTDSQYMGANIPGKPRECLYYLGGFTEYRRRCQAAIDTRLDEFVVGSARGSAVESV
ncbi:MAG TPA: NAD(P)/FAD-dependent oxidoreductase [Pseudonocardia sp.]|jgi:cyclohexanone monooxygenase|nr:NAD(P)/FAD-dependent oxidoreductase [Pseudonocardia sp.]